MSEEDETDATEIEADKPISADAWFSSLVVGGAILLGAAAQDWPAFHLPTVLDWSELIRNLGLVFVGAIGVWLALRRIQQTDRQIAQTQESLDHTSDQVTLARQAAETTQATALRGEADEQVRRYGDAAALLDKQFAGDRGRRPWPARTSPCPPRSKDRPR